MIKSLRNVVRKCSRENDERPPKMFATLNAWSFMRCHGSTLGWRTDELITVRSLPLMSFNNFQVKNNWMILLNVWRWKTLISIWSIVLWRVVNLRRVWKRRIITNPRRHTTSLCSFAFVWCDATRLMAIAMGKKEWKLLGEFVDERDALSARAIIYLRRLI